ncbi:hypothetical protein ABFB09_01070 [Dehalogenimonas sp. THU2]|uniref:hypothetical protein n=1 Tax=Dehalogenimonas sp. THU2 TaxID=3151121 RepID=UPI0032188231
MAEEFEEDRFRGTTPVAYSTNWRKPDLGRTFVWAWTQWYERLEGPTGAVAFTPVADWEDELRRWLKQQSPDTELTDISQSEFGIRVLEEFLDQTPLYPEAPELADENPFSEQGPGEDLEHY